MVESLIGMGKYFCWGLGLLFCVFAVYTLIRTSLVSYTPFMVILGLVLPVIAFGLVSAAIGAYFGSLIDSLLGIDNIFATAGTIGGLVAGLVLWRRQRMYPTA